MHYKMKHGVSRPYKANFPYLGISAQLEYSVLQDLVKRYSEFINFPIYLWSTKEVDVEVPADEEETSEDEESSKFFVNVTCFS